MPPPHSGRDQIGMNSWPKPAFQEKSLKSMLKLTHLFAATTFFKPPSPFKAAAGFWDLPIIIKNSILQTNVVSKSFHKVYMKTLLTWVHRGPSSFWIQIRVLTGAGWFVNRGWNAIELKAICVREQSLERWWHHPQSIFHPLPSSKDCRFVWQSIEMKLLAFQKR